MKKTLFIVALLLSAGIFILNSGCDEEPSEACQQDMFCDGTVEVTACCVEGEDCYYMYNGKKYPDTDDGLTALVADLNCSTTKDSESPDEAKARLIERLKWLIEDTKIVSMN